MRIKLVLFALSVLLASCSGLVSLTPHKIEIQQGNLITPEMRDKIKVGMSAPMVRSILGTPLINDPFHAKRWDYVYSLQQGGKVSGQQRLTLYFEDDHLSRIDDSAMPAEAAPVAATEKK